MDFWQFFWLLIWSYFMVALLFALFQIVADVFRDEELSGWSKAIWLLVLIVLPIIGAFAYLAIRGDSMAKRHAAAARQAREDANAYIQSVAQPADAVSAITSAKALLDSNTITQTEFNRLKTKALAQTA